MPANITLDNLPDVLTANVPIPAGTPLSENLQFPTTLGSGGLTGALTGVSVAVNSILGTTPLNAASSSFSNGVATISGQLGSFDPSDGLPIPTSFNANLVTSLLGPLAPLGVTCAYNANSIVVAPGANGSNGTDGTFGGIPVSKQKAKVRAHQIGRTAQVLVQVRNQSGKASGKVVAKMHGQEIGKANLKAGKVRLRLAKLKRGVNTVRVYYMGDATSQAAHKTVRVTIVRH